MSTFTIKIEYNEYTLHTLCNNKYHANLVLVVRCDQQDQLLVTMDTDTVFFLMYQIQ